MTTQDKDIKTAQETIAPESGGRRRFLGAGSAAAPFILTMVSQPALGVTCFTPSRSLSKNTSISQQGKYGECTNAESPGNYKTQQDPASGAYHWPASAPPSTPFHPLFTQGTRTGTSFTVTTDGVTRSMTLGEVISTGPHQDPEKVAFHLIGAYLNTMGGNGAVIPPNVITEQGVRDIWAEYASKGYYEPTASVQWGPDQIKNYLISNGIVKP